MAATSLIGEFECKVDAKGRFMFPINLKKQLEQAFEKGFVINRNLHQKCLALYPLEEWNKLNKKLGKLNRLKKDVDIFIRKVTGGATNCEADNTGRILIPKPLAEYANIKNDIKILGSNSIIEIWDKNLYETFLSQDIDIAKLADDVFEGIDFNDDKE
ncbi:MAG: division/cell wall cluster transcriptional repressor MraZ [Bacteroidetes bacterium]|nr:division/cell wall cluster transcriptional repressor MraZ [Bacteroidota bacterium]